MLTIAAIALSLGACGFSVWFALVPPQGREVRELRAAVADLSEEVDHLAKLLHKRARRENMEQAQAAKQEQGKLIDEAAAILAQAQTSPGGPARAVDPGAFKAQLRAKVLQ